MTDETRTRLKDRDTFFRLCRDMNVSYSTLSSYLSGRRQITPWAAYCFDCFEENRPIPRLNPEVIFITAEETRKIRGDSVRQMLIKCQLTPRTYRDVRKGHIVSNNSLWALHLYAETPK